MCAIRVLVLSSVLLLGACASSPPKPRGLFDLSSAPEPGSTVPPPTLAPAHTGGGRLGTP